MLPAEDLGRGDEVHHVTPSGIEGRPSISWCHALFSPTTATMASLESTVMVLHLVIAKSCANSLRQASTVPGRSEFETVSRCRFGEEDLAKSAARWRALRRCLKTCATTRAIHDPWPHNVYVTSLMAVSALTPPPILRPSADFVPGFSEQKTLGLRSHGNRCLARQGSTFFGCITFAPKYQLERLAIEITGIVRAPLQARVASARRQRRSK